MVVFNCYDLPSITKHPTAAMAQWVRAFTSHAEGWVFEYQSRQTYVVKTGSDSSIAKRSALGLSVTGPRRWPLQTDAPCHSGFGTLKNLHCSMVMSAEHSFWVKMCSPSPAMVTSPYVSSGMKNLKTKPKKASCMLGLNALYISLTMIIG